MDSLKRAWNTWKRVARVIGGFQARVVLSVLYGLLVAPVGLAARVCGDPLRQKRRRAGGDSYFLPRELPPPTLEDARGQG